MYILNNFSFCFFYTELFLVKCIINLWNMGDSIKFHHTIFKENMGGPGHLCGELTCSSSAAKLARAWFFVWSIIRKKSNILCIYLKIIMINIIPLELKGHSYYYDRWAWSFDSQETICQSLSNSVLDILIFMCPITEWSIRSSFAVTQPIFLFLIHCEKMWSKLWCCFNNRCPIQALMGTITHRLQ